MQEQEQCPEKRERISELDLLFAYLEVVILVGIEVTLMELASFDTSKEGRHRKILPKNVNFKGLRAYVYRTSV